MRGKEEKAITLIALVITIVILLILAGITLATLTGENGLFTRAKQAKQNTLDAQARENLAIGSYENAINEVLDGTIDSSREQVIIEREQYERLISRIDSLEEDIQDLRDNPLRDLPSTILYPNGTESNPPTITKNQRIEVNNPYPGHNLYLVVQIKYNDEWGETGFVYDRGVNGGTGIKASQLQGDNIDKIIMQSGDIGIIAYSKNIGNPFNFVSGTSPASLPYRLKVFCLD